METKIERVAVKQSGTGRTVGFHEQVTFTFEGTPFTASGAHVDPEFACGYPRFEHEHVNARGVLMTLSGDKMGPCVIVHRWPTFRSWVSSHMCQIEACIGGVRYTGRGSGSGMLWKGKPRRRARRR